MSKGYDLKTVFIVVLAVLLIANILINNSIPSNSDSEKERIVLQLENEKLKSENDSLNVANVNLEYIFAEAQTKLNAKDIELGKNQKIITELKKKRNEVLTYVDGMSGRDVANEFTKYLER